MVVATLFSATLAALSLAPSALAASYSISDTFVGSSFFSGFAHQAIADPTNGRVNYVSQSSAQSLNLSYASGDTFIMRSDFTTTLSAGGPGRNSVRLSSNKKWSTSTTVLNIRHMPQGCGTWPAFWSFGDNWPANGEIDIIEGVNDVSPNAATLHTSAGCTQPASGRSMTGSPAANDCNVAANGNAGCGVRSERTNSYGPSFNSNGGGWYAMERTSTYISVWFWPRDSTTVPADVKNGASSVNTSAWGTPFATFVNSSCDIGAKMGPHNIIFNLTFCGDWAGQAGIYSGAGCPGTCVDYVNNNPAAFKNAYFDIASLRVYA